MPEDAIISLLGKSLEFLNDENNCDVLARIAAFHFLFGYIRPFYDGNGRANRYISSHYLASNYEAIIGYGLSCSIKKRLSEYYKGFSTCEGKLGMGDLTPFVALFCDIVADAAKTAETAEQLKFQIEELKAQGEANRIELELKLAGCRNVKAVRKTTPFVSVVSSLICARAIL